MHGYLQKDCHVFHRSSLFCFGAWLVSPLSKALRFEEACKSGAINRDDESEITAFSTALSSALKASAKCVFAE